MTETYNYTIRPATPEDAPYISRAITMAVGDEITGNFAGSPERIPLVRKTFEELARRDDAQYSYPNAFVATDENGNVAGAVIAYDGAKLHKLRPTFVEVANEILGYNMKDEDFPDETSPDEIYLDTLAVFPEHRHRGLAGRLINAVVEKARSTGKPVGLLVDYDNPGARSLYEKCGFKSVGERPFAHTMMEHMQRKV